MRGGISKSLNETGPVVARMSCISLVDIRKVQA
jgi:hypothetical protein